MSSKTEKYTFQSDGFFTKSDKEVIAEFMEKKSLKKGEKGVIYHGKTRLQIEHAKNGMGYTVRKAVSGGFNYLYLCYFEKKS